MIMKELSCNASFGGQIKKYSIVSKALGGLESKINLFLPKTSQAEKVPLVVYLAGLTCNEDTGAQKGCFLGPASEHGVAICFPDTSPRDAKVPGEDDDWDFGTGAGFYLNATNEKWKAYRMEDFITQDLLGALKDNNLPLVRGGHGALTLYLNHPHIFKCASAFAPISHPTKAPWGIKAFAGPNNNDGYLKGGVEEGKRYDATEIILSKQPNSLDILVDYGSADDFYKKGQLLLDDLQEAVNSVGLGSQVRIRKHEGYDHSYWFISTFASDHIEFHAGKLRLLQKNA